MIEIKRKCSSSIRQDPVKHYITFGDFTLKITDEEWDLLDQFMQDTATTPIEALQELIYAALWKYSYPRSKLGVWQ